jgi:nicotinamidase-related amidase
MEPVTPPPSLETPPALTVIPAWIESWYAELAPEPLASALVEPAQAAIFSADMIIGFCREGNLASPRVDALTQPVVDLFQRAHDAGVGEFVLLQDTHDANSPEFTAFPPHCVAGTAESEMIPELANLPFRDQFTVIPKNSLAPGPGTNFDEWLDARPDLATAIVVGDCTDLCVYQLAMHLRLRANALNLTPFDVIVPVNCVDTFDLPEAVAHERRVMAHPGDFFHQVFLYHMALNGIRIVSALT